MSTSEGRHYQVISVLGRGGFGTVYRARLSTEGGFSKVVALKVLNPEMEGMAEMAMRMRDEARLLGLVNHRAIVQVDALVLLDGKWTVVMEYVEGSDVKALLNKGPFGLGPALEVARELGSALDFAYNLQGPDNLPLKLLHRDIKPGNVRVTPAGEVKLLDFGIARADFQQREAKTRALSFGTPDYMAPERFEFIDGPEGDVYAVGVLLWEMLTGEHFGQTSPAQERHDAKVMAALDKLWQATAGRSEDLVRFVGSMLAFDPAARPSAREVERRATELWRTLGDGTLRDWAEKVLPTITQSEEEAAPGDLASRKLTENLRSGAIPYPTEKLEAPAPPPPTTPASRAVTPPIAEPPMDGNLHSDLQVQPPKSRTGLYVAIGLVVLLVLGGGGGLAGWFVYKNFLSGEEGGVAEGAGDEQDGAGAEGSTTGADATGSTTTTTISGTSTTSADAAGSTATTDAGGTTGASATTTGTTASATTTGTTASATTTGTSTTAGATGGTSAAGGTTTTTTTTTDEKATDEKATVEKTADKGETTAPSRTGRVLVSGGARVRLLRGKTSVAPGNAVPAGAYTLEYTIAGQPAKQGGRVVVQAGETVNIVCSKGTRTCEVR